MAITTAPLNTTSLSSSVSSQNPTTLNVIANPAIFSPDIRPTILSSAIPPSTQQKLKEKVVKTPLKGIVIKTPEGMFLQMSDGKDCYLSILKEP
ncbi:hypothetical protein DAPPUDRAFT_331858 [Daphnia pulex]|nr:hypothetical protein DAPPUDRAFT_331858 [Daphnia pulex]|eukprot:EFX66655.1 hypothetical protein DAPPUDRAFT_331858 [Daphnia pulex]